MGVGVELGPGGGPAHAAGVAGERGLGILGANGRVIGGETAVKVGERLQSALRLSLGERGAWRVVRVIQGGDHDEVAAEHDGGKMAEDEWHEGMQIVRLDVVSGNRRSGRRFIRTASVLRILEVKRTNATGPVRLAKQPAHAEKREGLLESRRPSQGFRCDAEGVE